MSVRHARHICRKVWCGEPLVHDGDTISLPSNDGMGLGKALRFMGPTLTRRVPIALAALGPKNVELANLIGDESTVRQRIRAHEAAGVTHLDLQLHDPNPVAAIEKIREWTRGDPAVPRPG
jgi:hypothetical protein